MGNIKNLPIIKKLFPFVGWFEKYSFKHLQADLFAGISVALILIPQSMAYARLAGLPAYYGLYAASLPPIIAALFGSSRHLATGPVAIVSLMTVAALEPIISSESPEYIAYAITLALLVGIFQILLGTFRLGIIINFLSHPVINGFTNAAAIIIATSQLSKMFGVSVEKGEHHYETVINVIQDAFSHTHLPTLAFALGSLLLMFILRKYFPRLPYVLFTVVIATIISYYTSYYQEYKITFSEIICPETQTLIIRYNQLFDELDKKFNEKILLNRKLKEVEEKFGEYSKEYLDVNFKLNASSMDIELLKSKTVDLRNKLKSIKFYRFSNDEKNYFCSVYNKDLIEKIDKKNVYYLKVKNKKIELDNILFTNGGEIVGEIPQKLPEFKVPEINFVTIKDIISYVFIISVLGFLETISIAKAIAEKLSYSLDANRELIGQGLANSIGSFFQSYPVAGSFSRSAVNFQLGAVSGLSSVFTGLFVGVSILFFASYLYYLPQAILSSIIVLAVSGLINIYGFVHDFRANLSDGIISLITFFTTLYFAPHIDYGIFIGVGLSLATYIYHGMKPEIALLSKHPDTTFRNRKRFGLAQCQHIAVLRYNGSLVFKNVNYLENAIIKLLGTMPKLRYIVLVGNAINELDASGDYFLASIVDRIREAGKDMYITGLNDTVIDTMKRTLLYYKIGEDHFFRNVSMAVDAIWEKAHRHSDELICPLKTVVYEEKQNS